MALAQRTGRSRHRLVLLALTAITLLTVDLNGFGPIESAQRVVRDVLHPVTSLASTVFSPVGDAWNSVFNYGDLEDENDALRAELEELQGAAHPRRGRHARRCGGSSRPRSFPMSATSIASPPAWCVVRSATSTTT